MNTKKLIKNRGRSCFGCKYLYQNKCNWFYLVKKTLPKVIPPDVQRNGCDYYEQRVMAEGNDFIEKIMDTFKGELI
tara:strand:+ start:5724 stop:5951 length:228 start_codon:yes stop_codon:yes gene_type:complete